MRFDGRKNEELRKIEAKVGIIKRADGSAYFKMGNTWAIAACYGPKELHPKHLQDPERAILRAYYDMMSFSVPERKRPGPTRRSIELSLVIGNALKPAIFLEEFPKTTIDIYIQIPQADAGTRTAAINAASLALANAGIPMRDLVSAVAVGKINGELVLDLTKEEEDVEGATDFPIAMMPRKKYITLFQMDGEIDMKELKNIINLAEKGINKIYEIQKNVLRGYWK